MIIIGGATATGKSSVAIQVAKKLNGEIISADSMQIYKYMDIGTAKIKKEEQEGIPHYMIDIIEPYESFSVANFSDMVKPIIADIEKRGKLAIVVGGTGLYINSLIYDYKPAEFNEELRKKLYEEYNIYGLDYIYNKLTKIDYLATKRIHKNNVKRVIRALEVKILTGNSILDKSDKSNVCQYPIYILNKPREKLYANIDERVDKMFLQGLIEEVKDLVSNKHINFDNQSMQAIGYKEFKEYFNNEINETDLRNLIKQHTRNYAKRQITWFKSIINANWYDAENQDDIVLNIINDNSITNKKRN